MISCIFYCLFIKFFGLSALYCARDLGGFDSYEKQISLKLSLQQSCSKCLFLYLSRPGISLTCLVQLCMITCGIRDMLDCHTKCQTFILCTRDCLTKCSTTIKATRDLKGQCHKIFDHFFLLKRFTWAPCEQTKTVLQTFLFLRRYSIASSKIACPRSQ